MKIDYDIFRNTQRLSGKSLILEEVKEFLRNNVFISKTGIVKSFNFDTQTGVVIIPEYSSLRVKTRTLTTLKLDLASNDRVILLQSSTSFLDENDDNHFDKNYFYILNAVDLKKAKLELEELSIKTKKPIEMSVGDEATKTSLKDLFKEILDLLSGLGAPTPAGDPAPLVNLPGDAMVPINPVAVYASKIMLKVNKVLK